MMKRMFGLALLLAALLSASPLWAVWPFDGGVKVTEQPRFAHSTQTHLDTLLGLQDTTAAAFIPTFLCDTWLRGPWILELKANALGAQVPDTLWPQWRLKYTAADTAWTAWLLLYGQTVGDTIVASAFGGTKWLQERFVAMGYPQLMKPYSFQLRMVAKDASAACSTKVWTTVWEQ